MIIVRLLFILFLVITCQSAVVVNQITSITTNNLMYTGTIGVGNEKLFFIYYGFDGQTNPDNLASRPLFVAVGSPGRSAQYMNLAGIGPKWLNKDLTLADNGDRVTQFGSVLFLDLLGSGYSYASSAQAIPKTYKDFGVMLTKAINSFIAETNLGKSKSLYLIAQSTFVRTLPGLDDIDPLKGIVHIGAWFDLYGIGKYYGTGGVDLKIFTDSERITIESTFTNCYNLQRSSKFTEAHQCYETTLNYVESKTKNRNLYNIQLISNLTESLPMVQYYLSQTSVINALKAPTTNNLLFEAHAAQVRENLFEDFGRNFDSQISQFLKDYLSVKQVFVTGDYDYITYRKATRNWLQNTLTFVDSAKFKPLNLTEYSVGGKVVGYKKSVPQVAYYELLNGGHFAYTDVPFVITNILKELVTVGKDEKKHQNIVQIENALNLQTE